MHFPKSVSLYEAMGSGYSSSSTRIWEEICAIRSDDIRAHMIETVLRVPEYITDARRAGLYGPALSWITAHKRGSRAAFPYASVQQNDETSIMISPAAKALDYFHEALTILGIGESETLTHERLRSAYKRMSIKVHPDKGGSQKEFETLNRAYKYTEKILNRISPKVDKERMSAPVNMETAQSQRVRMPDASPPVQLSAKKLDVSMFNKLFEEHRLPDPERDDGYGAWLSSQGGSDEPAADPRLKGKFNQTMFEQVFREKALQNTSAITRRSVPDSIMPVQGVELGAAPGDFSSALGSDTQFVDLKQAYTSGSTIFQDVAGVSVRERSAKSISDAQRQRDSDMANVDPDEGSRIASAAAALEEREHQRRVRLANRDSAAEEWSDQVRRRLLVQ